MEEGSERKQNPEDAEESSELVSSGLDMAASLVNSEQCWRPALAWTHQLFIVGGEGLMRPLPLRSCRLPMFLGAGVIFLSGGVGAAKLPLLK